MSLALQKSLTPSNIKSGFRATGIQPLNKDAMLKQMGASEVFKHYSGPNEPCEVPSQRS